MENFSEKFKQRTKTFALDLLKFYQKLPKTGECKIIGNQLLRSGTSVAANYRAACRGRSDNEYYSKISIVIEEADETLFWLELLKESNIVADSNINKLMQEIEEILKIVVTIRQKLKYKKQRN